MESPITFGEWLRQSRIELRLTREECGRRIGCSTSLLRKIEYGERRPSVQIAKLIANCLNIPTAERLTFVKVARGELSVDRLPPASKLLTIPGFFSPSTTPRTNLPILPTPMIGREREVEELNQLLGNPQCRLLTLVGPGGMGKTRLAIETASHLQDFFTDGVYFVSLAPVNSTRLIVPVIADAVGFSFQSANGTDPKGQLFSYFKRKHVLLLLDNLEHLLVEPGIELLAELLAIAPQVKLLATSREAASLQGEWVFEVQGLPVPDSRHAQESAQNTCVELFLQRARRANVGFSAKPEDYLAIVRICQLVEGMPLGIEMAAAWVRTLTCDEIAREIERGLSFLSVSARDLPARHRSMRAVFDHSWKLLSDEERVVLRQLSVFQDGFRREAAEVVAGATLSVLSNLVTKSLVRRSGAGRYDLHELIRQFAAEQFTGHPEELIAIRARHNTYYMAYFSQADERLRSSAQLEALAELTAEMDNFRAAWEWAVAHGEFALIEKTMRTFVRLYDTRGWFQEGVETLGRAQEALESALGHSPSGRTEQIALGHLLATRAWLAYRLAKAEQAQAMLERSVDILHPLNEPHVLVESITYLGRVMEMTGNYARALELYSDGLEMATSIGNRWFQAVCRTLHTALVGIIHNMVEPEITHERLQSVVTDWRLIGDPRLIALGLDFLSRSALRLGRYDEARLALEENVTLNGSIGFNWGLGSAYRGLGIVAQAQDEHHQAVDMFHKSLDTFTELGGSWWVARVLADMSWSIFALGNDIQAERIWRESLRIATDIQGTPVALEALAGLASLQAKQGNMETAFELLLIVADHPASFQKTRNRALQMRAQLEAQLTYQEIELVKQRSGVKTFTSIVEDILGQTGNT